MSRSKEKATSKRVVPLKTNRAPRRAATATAAASDSDPLRSVEQFLYRQAECLDSGDWQGFIDLFAEDGVYWMPAEPSQTTGDGVPSIFYEDRDLMTVRMRRLGHPRAWSQKTEWAPITSSRTSASRRSTPGRASSRCGRAST